MACGFCERVLRGGICPDATGMAERYQVDFTVWRKKSGSCGRVALQQQADAEAK